MAESSAAARTDSVTLTLPAGWTLQEHKGRDTSGKAGRIPQRRRCWRAWNQLSRFQRSIFYLVIAALLVMSFYYIYLEPAGSSAAANVVKLNKERAAAAAAAARAKIDSEKVENELLNRLNPKIKNVRDAVNPAVDEHQNVAKEAHDEDYNEEEEEIDKDDDKLGVTGPSGNADRAGDSNEAGEASVEDAAAAAAAPGVQLPPLDHSLNFSGPTNDRQKAVVEAFKHAWKGYRAHAWGRDHLRPISRSGQNWFGLGLTIIDALDTMYIMGLTKEFEEAADWVHNKLSFDINKDVNLFETSIRVLGGLLSAYHLSGDKGFLDRAQDLGDRLMGSFQSPSGIPYSDVNLGSSHGHAPKWSPDSSTSEVTTIQLEFRDLSRATGRAAYEEAVEHITNIVHEQPKEWGLVPIFINANTGKFRKYATITMGARGDSYYEYLLKQWIQTGKTKDSLKADYLDAMDGVERKLCKRTVPNGLLFVGELISGGKEFKAKMDELVCFLPGTLALGVHHGLTAASHLRLAEELAYTCYLTFARQPTHLAPEITYFNYDGQATDDMYVKPNDAHYLLRPETVESLWYLYYLTGNKTYQDWGWNIFQGIEKYTRVSTGGYTTVGNVRSALDLRPKDMMESFFLGETLKYFYLLFADRQEIDLRQWVFNTEAHPLPIYPE